MPRNRPRRASVARWLADAPPSVLDCFDHGGERDRYTILLKPRPDDCAPGWAVPYLALDAWGRGSWGELSQVDAALGRSISRKRRVRWRDLPEAVRAAVVARHTAEP